MSFSSFAAAATTGDVHNRENLHDIRDWLDVSIAVLFGNPVGKENTHRSTDRRPEGVVLAEAVTIQRSIEIKLGTDDIREREVTRRENVDFIDLMIPTVMAVYVTFYYLAIAGKESHT